jgi:hypothetical protein
MKKIILSAIGLAMFSIVQAQEQDSIIKDKKTKSTAVLSIGSDGLQIAIGGKDTIAKKPEKYPKINFGFNIEHFDIGLSKYHIGSDFGTPTGYDFLDNQASKTLNIGLDLFEMGIRLNPNFKMMLAAGIDWNLIRLRKNVTILPDQSTLSATTDIIEYDKNRLSSRYLRIPFYFEYRTNKNEKGKRATIVFGPEVGFLLDGKLKQKSNENGKVKIKDDYNFEQFRYGANLRVGYKDAGIFFKYYMNDVFAKNQGPSGYKNLNFGFTFGF